MSKEYILKVLFAAGLLFVLFLWSGGIYKYEYNGKVRINKITAEIQIVKNGSWKNALKD